MTARSLMLQGTGSDVGKTVLVAALCRLFTQRGLKVLPFKPQNMSNNAAVADDGGEIGRAQWLQAIACGVEPSVHMNPVLLKPESEHGAQVVVHGKVAGRAEANYYREHKANLLQKITESFAHLKQQADLVLVEGAGSPAEVNLRAADIANMGFALPTKTPTVLVGDINRGGVIASIVGTHAVLPAEERALIKGTIINQFRGDMRLFDDGLKVIQQQTGWQNFGVVPFSRADKQLPAEDAVVLEEAQKITAGRKLIVVPLLPQISNFDDFDALRDEDTCELIFCPPGSTLPQAADLIMLPGSKSTIADLKALKREGWDVDILAHARAGKPIFGVCGGYQMLGHTVVDADGVEGSPGSEVGLGLLDIETHLLPRKTAANVTVEWPEFRLRSDVYEIHCGESVLGEGTKIFAAEGKRSLGAISSDGKVAGAYLHRMFDDGVIRSEFLREFLGVESSRRHQLVTINAQLDSAAETLEKHLDVDGLLAAAS